MVHATWRWRPASLVLTAALALAHVVGAVAANTVPVYDSPLPSRIVVGVEAYPPFVMLRAWVGVDLQTLYTDLPGTPQRGVLEGVNTSLVDGFDIAFLQLVLTQQLGVTDLVFKSYPDTVSLYVGLRNGEVDLVATAVEFDPTRATCAAASCPALNASGIVELPTSDYGQPAYLARQAQVCCLSYGTPYYQSGFALLSLSQPLPTSVVEAIVNVDVLNAGTPVLVALFSYGFIMTAIEWRGNRKMFSGIWASAYYASVATATFGFGDVIPLTALGRGLTVFWTVFTVLSLTAFSGVVSSKLTVGSLSYTQINDFSSLQPSDLCIESSYPLASSYVAGIYGLPLDSNGRVVGIMHASVPDCFAAVQSGKVKAFVDDFPLLQWLGFVYSQSPGWYVSPSLKPNPLTWAYPSGSPLKPVIDAAVMRTIVGSVWYPAAQSVVQEWLPTGTTTTGLPVTPINWPWLAAAIAFVAFWLVFGSLENTLKMQWLQALIAKGSRRHTWLRPFLFGPQSTDPLTRLDAARKHARDAHIALDAALYDLAVASASAAAAAEASHCHPKAAVAVPHGDTGEQAPEAPAAL